MKNIKEILAEAGVEVSDEQLTKVEAGVKDNYRTTTDYDKQKEKLTSAEEKVTALTESLDKFKDVDPDALQGEIDKLKGEIAQKDTEYATKIADRDFDDALRGAIAEAGGLNAKAIRSLLDIDSLKASKNQGDDIKSAIQALTEAEDSKMLFKMQPEQPDQVGKIDAVGKLGKADTVTQSAIDKMFAAAGFSLNDDNK